MSGGQISGNGNGNNIPALSQSGFFACMHLGRTDRAYTLKLRNVSVINNYNLNNVPGAAPRNTPGNSGLTLAGNASSSFDLGAAASPGGSCKLSTGDGGNYRVVTGTLRLAQ